MAGGGAGNKLQTARQITIPSDLLQPAAGTTVAMPTAAPAIANGARNELCRVAPSGYKPASAMPQLATNGTAISSASCRGDGFAAPGAGRSLLCHSFLRSRYDKPARNASNISAPTSPWLST